MKPLLYRYTNNVPKSNYTTYYIILNENDLITFKFRRGTGATSTNKVGLILLKDQNLC